MADEFRQYSIQMVKPAQRDGLLFITLMRKRR